MEGAPHYRVAVVIAMILRITGAITLGLGIFAGVMRLGQASDWLIGVGIVVGAVLAASICLAAAELLLMLRDMARNSFSPTHTPASMGTGLTASELEQAVENALRVTAPNPMDPPPPIRIKTSSSRSTRKVHCNHCGKRIKVPINSSRYQVGASAKCPACGEMTVV